MLSFSYYSYNSLLSGDQDLKKGNPIIWDKYFKIKSHINCIDWMIKNRRYHCQPIIKDLKNG